MKRILVGFSLMLLLGVNAFPAIKDDIQMVDGKVSIQATAMPLRQFLQLLDTATGMTSKVPPALANEKISVRLEGLDLPAAIRKSFQGQPWNYYVAEGRGITIIDKAQAVAATTGGISSPIPSPIESRIDNPPPPVPISAPVLQPAPPPVATATSPAALTAPNLPAAQGGAAPAPAPLFQPVGATLGGALPGSQPAR